MKQKMGFTKKLIGLILLLALSVQSLYCSELFSWEQAYQQLDNIELNLNEALNLNKQLETKNKELETQVNNLEFKVNVLDEQVLNWETLYNLQTEESKRQLQVSKNLEKQCKLWKSTTMICGTGLVICMTTSVILIIQRRLNKGD